MAKQIGLSQRERDRLMDELADRGMKKCERCNMSHYELDDDGICEDCREEEKASD